MTLFLRQKITDRLDSFSYTQPIEAIETTDEELRLKVDGSWQHCPWNDVRNAVLKKVEALHVTPKELLFPKAPGYKQRTPEEAIALMEQRKQENDPRANKLRSMGVQTTEQLSFTTPTGTWTINLSSVGSHFEQNEALRDVLLEKLHPTLDHKRLPFDGTVSPKLVAFMGIISFLGLAFVFFNYVYPAILALI